MYQSVQIDGQSVVSPALPAPDLRRLLEKVIDQNDKLIDANCRLIDALAGSPAAIVGLKSTGKPLLADSV